MGCFVLLVQDLEHSHISPQKIKTWLKYNMNYPRIPLHGTPSKKGYFPRNLKHTDVQFAWTEFYRNIPSEYFSLGSKLTNINTEKLVDFAMQRTGLSGHPKQICNKIIALDIDISTLVPVDRAKKEVLCARESSGQAQVPSQTRLKMHRNINHWTAIVLY